MKRFKIVHKREDCIGCGACVEIAPQCFTLSDDDGQADLVGGSLKSKLWVADAFVCDRDDVDGAVEACPMNIIRTEN